MKRKTAAALVIAVFICSALLVGSFFMTPSSLKIPLYSPTVPSVQLSYPLISTGGYVNRSVQFIATVNMPLDSPAVNSISYRLDGGEPVVISNLAVTTYDDYGPTKVDYRAYKADILLKNLSEGNHTLAASANGMSTSEFFVVNSYYHITALHVLSPASPIYLSNDVPLQFTYTGDITNAHYYLYSGRDLVSDGSLSGDTTLPNLPLGSYKLLVFVTTQYGQDSAMINFVVFGLITVAVVSLFVILSLSIGVLVYFKKVRHKKSSLSPEQPEH